MPDKKASPQAKRVVIYGGSFNPPHIGHMTDIEAVLRNFDCDELWIMPSADRLDKKIKTSGKSRTEMLRIAVREFFPKPNIKIKISDIELKRPKLTTTYDTLMELKKGYPGVRFYFLLGSELPFYYGYFRYGGGIHLGKHEPMITKKEFDDAQYILGLRNKPRPQVHDFAFTGMMRCGECGSGITAEKKIKRQKNGNVHYYAYYRCTKKKNINCSQKYVKDNDLANQITEQLQSIEIPEEFSKWALEILRSMNQKEAGTRDSILISQRKAYDFCLKKIDSLIDMRMSGEINEDEFVSKKADLILEKNRLYELLRDTNINVDNWLDDAEKYLKFAENAKTEFETAEDPDAQKQILANLGSNLLIMDQKLILDIATPLERIKAAAETAKLENNRLEPPKSVYSISDFEKLYSEFPLLGPMRGTIITILSDTAYMQNLWNSFTFLMEMQKNESLANV